MLEDRQLLKVAPFWDDPRVLDLKCHYAGPAYPVISRALCGTRINRDHYIETRSTIQTVTCKRCQRKAERLTK